MNCNCFSLNYHVFYIMCIEKMNEIQRVRDSEISPSIHGYGAGRSLSMEEVAGATGSRRHSRRSSWRIDEDEEALKWAALERLPTYDRLRTSILRSILSDEKVVIKEVDVRKLNMDERQRFMDRFIQVAEEDNEKFLRKFRDRIDKYVYLCLIIYILHAKIQQIL